MYIFRILLLDGQSWRHPVRQIPRVDFQIDDEVSWYKLLHSGNSDDVDYSQDAFRKTETRGIQWVSESLQSC